MRAFALWLCDVDAHPNDLTLANCRASMPSAIEADWLWNLLQRHQDDRPLLERAQRLASMAPGEKSALAQWIHAVATLQLHFMLPPQPNLPTVRPVGADAWGTFKSLFIAFYGKGFLQIGIPYLSDGTPTGDQSQWLTYQRFRGEFLQINRDNPSPNARNVCVLCGHPLTKPVVDHWVRKAAFPLLAVCADNLLPTCDDCNEAPNKGEKDVHTNGSVVDWFHPYLRPGNQALCLGYSRTAFSVTCASFDPADQRKVENLDRLLNLAHRWTTEYKAEHIRLRSMLRQREKRRVLSGQARHSQVEVQLFLQQVRGDLLPSEPHFAVHSILCTEVLTEEAIEAWHADLASMA